MLICCHHSVVNGLIDFGSAWDGASPYNCNFIQCHYLVRKRSMTPFSLACVNATQQQFGAKTTMIVCRLWALPWTSQEAWSTSTRTRLPSFTGVSPLIRPPITYNRVHFIGLEHLCTNTHQPPVIHRGESSDQASYNPRKEHVFHPADGNAFVGCGMPLLAPKKTITQRSARRCCYWKVRHSPCSGMLGALGLLRDVAARSAQQKVEYRSVVLESNNGGGRGSVARILWGQRVQGSSSAYKAKQRKLRGQRVQGSSSAEDSQEISEREEGQGVHPFQGHPMYILFLRLAPAVLSSALTSHSLAVQILPFSAVLPLLQNLKAENILLDENLRAKIGDFGQWDCPCFSLPCTECSLVGLGLRCASQFIPLIYLTPYKEHSKRKEGVDPSQGKLVGLKLVCQTLYARIFECMEATAHLCKRMSTCIPQAACIEEG
eukprot:scaffold30491_cov18-Tisochrysis_lutea.AAC.1